MLPRHGVKAALPNTQTQTQGGCQNEETKKCGPNEIEQNSRKISKQMEDKQSIRCKVQNIGYKNAQGALAGVAQWIEHELQTKGRQFHTQSGHVPGLWARSPVGTT